MRFPFSKKTIAQWMTGCIVMVLLLVLALIATESSAPAEFPAKAIVTIPSGMTLRQAAALLEEKHIVRSALFYRAYATMFGGTGGVKSGAYLFNAPQSALRVALRTVQGDSGLTPIKTFIPEGSDTSDIAVILGKNIAGFDTKSFLAEARPDEGYLFPDTYYFTEVDTPDTVITVMKQTFNAKELTVAPQIVASGHSESDIITMASIVEREATSTADRRMIAGILWKRISIGMPLQVDPPFYYVLGKDGGALTEADLKIDSPYNTYTHTGLPPTPIDSPSLDAITAALTPTASPYLYYVSGKDGVTHYAATLVGQDENIREFEL